MTEKPPVTVTRSRQKLVDAAVTIQMNPLESEISYMAQALVQATLPHSDPGAVPVWGRTNGHLTLTIKPDWEIDPKTRLPKCVGVPYGTIPRLLLFWITTEAVQTKQRRLELGESLSAFMRQLDLTPTGGRFGSIPRLRDQMNRLFRAKISFEATHKTDQGQGTAWLDMQVAPKGELWWNHSQPEQPGLWKSWIELGESFYEAIRSSPVPVDMRALKALKRSPMALDLYAWLNYRTFTLNQKGKEQFIPWRALEQQLGSDYGEFNDFRRKAIATIQKIAVVSPGLSYSFVNGGLMLRPGKTAIRTSPKSR